jgi:chemotaxis protein histidine kinase CheA
MDEEIVQEFCSETKVLLSELEPLLEALELNPANFKALEDFGQKVDRIMGAAKSLEFHQMGLISEFCKTISYKSAQSKNTELVIIVVAFLFEAVEILNAMIENLQNNKRAELDPSAIKPILSRLEFISGRLAHIQRSSVAINDKDLLDLSETFNKLSKNK